MIIFEGKYFRIFKAEANLKAKSLKS